MWEKKAKCSKQPPWTTGSIDTLKEMPSSDLSACEHAQAGAQADDKVEGAPTDTNNMIGSFIIPPLWCDKCCKGLLSELRKTKGIKETVQAISSYSADGKEVTVLCGIVEFVSRATAIHALDGVIIPSLAKEACHMVRIIFSLDNGDITYSIRQGEVISCDDQLGISRRSQYKELEECERLLSILQSKEWYSEPELEQIYYRNIKEKRHDFAEKLELLMNLGLIQRADNTTKILYGIHTRGIKFIKKGIMELLWYDRGYMSTLHKSIATWQEGIATLRGAVALIADHDDRFLLPEAKMAEDLEEQRSKEFDKIRRRIEGERDENRKYEISDISRRP